MAAATGRGQRTVQECAGRLPPQPLLGIQETTLESSVGRMLLEGRLGRSLFEHLYHVRALQSVANLSVVISCADPCRETRYQSSSQPNFSSSQKSAMNPSASHPVSHSGCTTVQIESHRETCPISSMLASVNTDSAVGEMPFPNS